MAGNTFIRFLCSLRTLRRSLAPMMGRKPLSELVHYERFGQHASAAPETSD
jgi:hypothetical protein